MIKEVAATAGEMKEVKSEKAENFKEIKPESSMTVKEAKGFWDDTFGKGFDGFGNEEKSNKFSNIEEMKQGLEKTVAEIKEVKPPNSPDIAKWFDNEGFIEIGEKEGKQVWTYRDSEGKEVPYVDGYPDFPAEAKHPDIKDINIGKFTGDRDKDKRLYLEKLEENYGLTEIPEEYELHHDSKNGNMQLIKIDWHKEFTHTGGYSKFKEEE